MTTKTDRVAGVPVSGKEREKVIITGSGTESAVLEENWWFLRGPGFGSEYRSSSSPRVWG